MTASRPTACQVSCFITFSLDYAYRVMRK
jgi:hypothetical protein